MYFSIPSLFYSIDRYSYTCELKRIKLFVLILAIQYYFVGCQFIFESELLLVR
jgi:hypothetical protein